MSLSRQLLLCLLDDARALEAEGFASRAHIDAAMRLGAGHPQGPFELMGRPPRASGDSSPPTDGAQLDRAAVIGTGTMAAGIAEVMARAGVQTKIVGRTAAAATGALERIGTRLARAVERQRLSDAERSATLSRLEPETELSTARNAQLAIEAVVESLEVKRSSLRGLSRRCPRRHWPPTRPPSEYLTCRRGCTTRSARWRFTSSIPRPQ